MCTFTFLYSDGTGLECKHIKSAAYVSGSRVDIEENSLHTHAFPSGKDLWLFSENGSFSVSHDGLRRIEVTVE